MEDWEPIFYTPEIQAHVKKFEKFTKDELTEIYTGLRHVQYSYFDGSFQGSVVAARAAADKIEDMCLAITFIFGE